MKPREFTLPSGTRILLGRNSENNDELVKKFEGKENIILHTAKPGSPFCVIENAKESKKLTKEELYLSGSICASKSQDWRDNKGNVIVHQFTGKDIYKDKTMKSGSWGIKKRPKRIKIKKGDIEKLENAGNKTNTAW